MKKLSLILTGIKSFKKNNPIVFFVYITGYMLMCFVFIYVYTNYMPSVIDGADNDVQKRYYRFSVSDDSCDFEQLYEYLRTYEPLYCDLYTSVSLEEMFGEGAGEEEIRVKTRLDSCFENYFLDIGNPQRVNSDFVNNENIIVMPEGLGYKEKTIDIGKDRYEVILAESGEPDVVIPFNHYNKHFCPESITIVVGETLRNGRHEEFLNYLENEFGVYVSSDPSEYLGSDYEKNMYYSRLIAVIFGIAVCVFMIIIRFLLEYSKYEYTIYRLVGAKYDIITSLIFSQTIVINGVLIALSIGIYELFYDGFFEKINMYDNIHMKMSDYVFMTGILMMFSAIAIVPFIIFSIRNSVSKCINYYS